MTIDASTAGAGDVPTSREPSADAFLDRVTRALRVDRELQLEVRQELRSPSAPSAMRTTSPTSFLERTAAASVSARWRRGSFASCCPPRRSR
jgi:hypothetical protein